MYPGMAAILQYWLPKTASFLYKTLNVSVAEKSASLMLRRFFASCQGNGVFIWLLSMVVSA
jgi:hypothetical protein